MKMTKRFLALFLALLMAFGSVPSAVLAAGEEEAAPAATAEPAAEAVSEPAPEPAAEPVPEPTAEPTPEPTAVPTAEPTAVPTEEPVEQPEQAPVVPQAPTAQEQPGVEAPMNENENEYSSAPSSCAVTWKMTVDGGVLPDIEDVFAPGALLTPPEEADQYEAQGYELTYYLDEQRTQKVDFDVDYILVSADMTVWADVVLPAPAASEVPAEPEVTEEPGISTMALDDPIAPIAADGTVTVYLYVQLTGNGADHFKQEYNNGEGWITVGKIEIPQSAVPSMSAVPSDQVDQNPNDTYGVCNYVSEHRESIEYYQYSGKADLWSLPGFDINDIDWAGGSLAVRNGADGYPNAGACWHLNGCDYEIKETGTVTVNYYDMGGNKIKDPYTSGQITYGHTYDVGEQVPSGFVDEHDTEYVLDHQTGDTTGTISGRDVTINVYYKIKTYSVTYDWGNVLPTEQPEYSDPLPELPTGGEYQKGQTYTVSATPAAGTVYEVKNEYGNTLEKYTFSGWNDPNNGMMGTSNVIITGEWTKEIHRAEEYEHTVKYVVKGDIPSNYVVPAEQKYAEHQEYTVASPDASLYDVEENGVKVKDYTFDGWYTDAAMQGDKVIAPNQVMGTENVTYYGKWTAHDMTAKVGVRFFYNDTLGEPPEGYTVPELSGQIGSTVTLEENSLPGTTTHDGVNYMLQEGGTYSATVLADDSANIDVRYVADANGDGIADSTQTLLITIYGGEAEATYDGQVHDSSEVKLQYSYAIQGDEKNWKYDNLPAGVTVELAGGYSSVVSGTNAGYYYANLLDKDEEDNFAAFVVNKGTFADAVIVGASQVSLHITKAPLTVTLETTRTYTGEEIKETLRYIYGDDEQNEGLTLKAEGLADSDRVVSAQATVSGTDVGDHETLVTELASNLQILKDDGTYLPKKDNYNITFEAILHIVKPKADEYTASVTVTNVNEYDALSYGMQPVPKGTITEGPGREDYREPTYTYYEKVGSGWKQMPEGAVPKNVGDYYVEATWAGVEPNLPEVTAQSRVFHIRPLNLMFNGNVYREYTGDLISVPVTEDMYNLLNGLDKFGYPGEHLVLSDPVSGTVVGDYPHYFGNKDAPHFGAKVLDAKSNDVTENYTVGGVVTLHITPAVLTVKPKNASKTYGEDDPALEYDVSGWKGSDGTTLALAGVVLSRKEGERVGHYEITATGPETLGKNYTVNYDEKGDFEITKAPLTITANGTLTYTGNTYNVYVDVEGSGPVGSTYHIKGEPVEGALQFNDKLTGLNFQVGGVAGPAGIDKEYKNLPAGSYTITNSDNENVSGCYDVTLEVHISFTRQLAADALSSRYDGKEHANVEVRDLVTGAVLTEGTDYEVSYVNDHYGDDAAEGDVTNAGHVSFAVTGKGDYDGATVTYDKYVTNEVGEHQYEITRRPATLTAATESWPYDGQPHKATTIEQEGFVAGQGVDPDWFSFEQITDVGSIDNVLSKDDKLFYRAKEGTDLNNYDITEVPGTLTVTQITLTADDVQIGTPGNWVYDGQPHPWEPVVRTTGANARQLTKGKDYIVGYARADGKSDDYTNVGEITVTVTFQGNYAGGPMSASYSITPRPVTLRSADGKWTYDGTAHSADTVTDLTAGQQKAGIVDGESFVYENFPTITDAGWEANTYDVRAGENTDLSNYKITEQEGTLTITAKAYDPADPENGITITPPEDVIYNGKAQEQEPTIKDGEKTLVKGTDYDLSWENNTNAGEAKVTVKFKGNYSGEAETSFQIKQFAIDLYGRETKPYNGKDQTISFNADIHTGQRRNIETHGNTLHASITGKNVGTYDIDSLAWSVVDSNGKNVSDNYTVAVQGHLSLTITPAELTVTAEDKGKRFGTGDPELSYTVTGWQGDDESEGLLDGMVTLTREPGEAVGEYDITPSVSKELKNYTIKTETGTFTIRQAYIIPGGAAVVPPEGVQPEDIINVTVGELPDRVYNGQPQEYGPALTAGGETLEAGVDYELSFANSTNVGTVTVTVTGIGNYTGQFTTTYAITPAPLTVSSESNTKVYDGTALTAPGSVEGLVNGETVEVDTVSITNAGTVTNTPTIVWGSTDSRNYTVTNGDIGTLTVTARPVTVNTESAAQVYDGTALTAPGSVEGLAPGETATVNTTSITDAATVDNDYTIAWGTADSRNYAVSDGDIGTLTVTARPVTLTSGSATRAYNGAALTNGAVTVGGQGFVGGQGAAYTVTGSQTAVGTSANAFTYRLTGGAQARNYDITTATGTLTVTPAPAGSMAANTPTNFLYDGAAHQWTPTVTGIGGAALTAGVDYNVTYSTANFTDAGAITATITGIGNYAGSTVTRTYRINQRLVIMSSGDATRAYNGQPLTNDDVTVTGNGFAAGDGATYNVTGRRTLPGTARNLFTYRLNAGTDADNYTIMQVYGDLTVEPAENTAEIEDNETPLGGQPDDADDADGGDDAEIAEIEDDDTPLAALPVIDDDDDGNGGDGGYALNEQTEIIEDAAPLAGGPAQQECCILHFIIMLGALCVAMYYTHDRKKRQEREYELRAEMQQQ